MTFASDVMLVDVLADGRYRLAADLVYHGRDETFTVPESFVTDFASVPRFLTALVPVAGRWDRAAVVHDWLCVQLAGEHRAGAQLVYGERTRHIMTRVADEIAPVSAVDTDGIFRRILRELGTPVVLRWLFWCGVRWGALANPARRAGWLSTALPVLGISLLALPFVLPVGVVTALALAVGGVLEMAVSALSRPRSAEHGSAGTGTTDTGSTRQRGVQR